MAKPRDARAEKNTFGLPQGDAIRRQLVKEFKAQRKRILASLPGRKAADAGLDPDDWTPPDLVLGARAESERMVPHLAAIWDDAGRDFLTRIDLDPDRWSVTNPKVAGQIERAAFDFCQSTNNTTSQQLGRAKIKLREALHAGTVERGDSLRELTKAVGAIFDQAETWRARRIAATEASRAVHSAELEAAAQSQVVAGFAWLLSEDACPLCKRIAAECPRARLGDTFATIGSNPIYSAIRHPPGHPGCQCSTEAILLPENGGPTHLQWPPPADDDPEKA